MPGPGEDTPDPGVRSRILDVLILATPFRAAPMKRTEAPGRLEHFVRGLSTI